MNMTRKEFIKMCGVLGIGLPFHASLSACTEEITPINSGEKVLIIGAGAAGLSAAYLLKQRGIEAEILEASSTYGGRMKRTIDFADFPIPLGAEWLHIERGIFEEIINDSSISLDVATTPYNPDVDYGLFEGQRISVSDVGFTIDQKFIGSTWFDFFDQYIVPAVEGVIRYNTVVESIDYSGEEVLVQTQSQTFTAAKVIVTVPVKMLQQASIRFTPELPDDKLEAINQATVWDGFKAFIEFSEKFYPAFVAFNIQPETAGQKLYYDAAYGQQTDRHILGLFTVGTGTLPYRQLRGDALIQHMLTELDERFDNKASASYVKHISQNWNAEPYIQGAYVYDHENWRRVRTLGEPIGDKLLFAGTCYTEGNDWGSVHTAARSARRAVDLLAG